MKGLAHRRCKTRTIHQSYWGRSHRGADAGDPSAWIAAKEGVPDQAMRFHARRPRTARMGASRNVIMEKPPLSAARECWPSCWLEVGQPTAALKEYETALKQTPNRYRAFWGAAPRRRCEWATERQASEYFGKPRTQPSPRTPMPSGRKCGRAKAFLAAAMIRWLCAANGCAQRDPHAREALPGTAWSSPE